MRQFNGLRVAAAAPGVSDSLAQRVADLASPDGLIASGGLTVYVLGAALRAAFSDA
jgi:hypothetical protein